MPAMTLVTKPPGGDPIRVNAKHNPIERHGSTTPTLGQAAIFGMQSRNVRAPLCLGLKKTHLALNNDTRNHTAYFTLRHNTNSGIAT